MLMCKYFLAFFPLENIAAVLKMRFPDFWFHEWLGAGSEAPLLTKSFRSIKAAVGSRAGSGRDMPAMETGMFNHYAGTPHLASNVSGPDL